VPSVKNKWVKPGGSFNYTEGQKVLNQDASTTYPTLCAVQIRGVAGGVAVVEPADASTAEGIAGRILFLRHAIPHGRYGVGTPWIIATGTARNPIDTDAATVDDPVYIDDTGTGGWTLTAPSTGSPAGFDRIIGYVLVKDPINGAISFANTNAL